jgi:hypothetical protein
MTHYNLLIEVECNSSDNRYSKLLKILEIPRGLTISVTFYITNLSNTNFNGTLTEINTLFNKTILGSDATIRKEEKTPITNLSKQKRELWRGDMQMFIEGNGWFECILKPYNKEDTIEYFTNGGNRSLGTKSWTQVFTVINREQLEIIKLLQEIRDKIKVT